MKPDSNSVVTAATTAAARYDGPLALAQSLSAFALAGADGATFTRDGPRADVEYRDLGLAAATNGHVGIKHIRAIAPCSSRSTRRRSMGRSR